jgi:hypothetical protein
MPKKPLKEAIKEATEKGKYAPPRPKKVTGRKKK